MMSRRSWAAAVGTAVATVLAVTAAAQASNAGAPASAASAVRAAVAPAAVASLPAVSATTRCADLVGRDFRGVRGAPTRLDSATEVPAGGAVAQPYCDVRGHTGAVHFTLKLPITGWTQRFLMVGCGGYCGSVGYSERTESDAGCPLVESGELAVATTDLGHVGSSFAADGLWGLNNPTAIIDFGYAGMHKTTLAAKAVIAAYYGQRQRYAYI